MQPQNSRQNRSNLYRLIRWGGFLLGGLMLLGVIVQPLAPVYGADILLPTETPAHIVQPTLTPTYGATPTTSPEELLMKQVNIEMYAGNNIQAIHLLEAVLELNPNYVEAHQKLGLAYSRTGDYEAALQSLDRAHQLNPNNGQYLLSSGHVYEKMENYEMALATYNEAIQLGNRSAYSAKIVLLHTLRDYVGVVETYDQLILTGGDSYNNYLSRGFYLLKTEEWERSIADSTRAIELYPDAYAYNNRGFALLHLGEIDAGLADINQSLQLDDTNPLAYHNRGVAYFMLGQPDRAIADYMQAITFGIGRQPMGYDEADAYRGLGEAYDAQGKTTPALRHYLMYVVFMGDAADVTVLERIAELEGDS